MLDSLSDYATAKAVNLPTIKTVGVPSLPVTGQSLSRKRNWQPHERSFVAADLYRGTKRLIEPTLAQAAALTGAGSTSSVWWATQREAVREEIMLGLLPMVPPREMKSRASITDDDLFDIVREAGIGRVLEAACALEAAQ
jgi:hypothetical protein